MLDDGSKVIALIPARGGSKGIVKKNLVELSKNPLIFYTIIAAKKSNYIDEVWVSSDDDEVLLFSSKQGVKIRRRPKKYATDASSAVEVVRDFILKSKAANNSFMVYLQPTSPLRTYRHIDDAIYQMCQSKLISVLSVFEVRHSPYKSFNLGANGELISIFDERLSNARRQDLPKCFYPNGAIYGFRVSEFLKRGGFPSNGSFPYVMSEDESIDIDTKEDLLEAEFLMGIKNNG